MCKGSINKYHPPITWTEYPIIHMHHWLLNISQPSKERKKNGTCAHESFLFESSYAFNSEGRCLIIKKTSLISIMIEKQAIKIFCFENIFLYIILFLEILNDWGIYCFSSKYICMYVYTWWSLFNMCMLDQFKLNTETRPCKKKNTPKTMKISD